MRTTITTIATAATLAVAVSTLGACGSTSEPKASDHCRQLKADKAYFQTFAGADPDLTRLDGAFKRMHSLAASAPESIAQDWETIDGAVTSIEGALDDAGVDFADLAAMQDGHAPKNVNLQTVAALGPKLQALSGPAVDDASRAIVQFARESCGVDLTIR